jgi:hypothetical protein
MPEEIFKNLIRTIYTVEDFHDVLGILKHFLNEYFYKGDSKTTIYAAFTAFIKAYNKDGEEAQAEHGNVFPKVTADFFSSFTKENSTSLLQEIESLSGNVPHMVFYVPVRFPESLVQRIGVWVRKNVHEHTLLEMKVDRLSVGGCQFVWQGVFHDYSIQYFINKKRNDIRNMIRSMQQ